MEVVGGIYSLQPLPSRWLTLLSMGTPDSLVVHRTWYCSLFDVCHVSLTSSDRAEPSLFCRLVVPSSRDELARLAHERGRSADGP
jgi:hypothetical protein